MSSLSAVARATRRDRIIIVLGLTGITLLAWTYTIYLASEMAGMDGAMSMSRIPAWGPLDLALLFLMWAIMMIAMMMPSASPMILMYTANTRARAGEQGVLAQTSLFVAGYLVVWVGFSVIATLIQWSLHSAALLSATMMTTSTVFGGVLFVLAGVFQWTPLKHACLRGCRSPLGFLMTEWRDGAPGAFIMGWRHGLLCLGCCWALMALLFVAGVMNLLWIAAIAVFVLVEKISPAGDWLARFAGGLMTGYGILLIASASHD